MVEIAQNSLSLILPSPENPWIPGTPPFLIFSILEASPNANVAPGFFSYGSRRISQNLIIFPPIAAHLIHPPLRSSRSHPALKTFQMDRGPSQAFIPDVSHQPAAGYLKNRAFFWAIDQRMDNPHLRFVFSFSFPFSLQFALISI